MHALNSCRMEKKFVHYGHDVADHDTPLECGMGFVLAFDKDVPFIGRDAMLQQKESRSFMNKRLVQFLLEDPQAILYHHEPILRDGKIVGHLTSVITVIRSAERSVWVMSNRMKRSLANILRPVNSQLTSPVFRCLRRRV